MVANSTQSQLSHKKNDSAYAPGLGMSTLLSVCNDQHLFSSFADIITSRDG